MGSIERSIARRKAKSKKSKPKRIANRVTSPAARVKTALECAKIGMRVAPLHGMKDGKCTCGDAECRRPGQHVRMPNGIDDATSKPEEIKAFFEKHPKAKLAIATGVAGVIALKVTGKTAHAGLAEHLGWTNTVEIGDGHSTIFFGR
jgi:Bifunctional DNA primase/polymerase, N-terminal